MKLFVPVAYQPGLRVAACGVLLEMGDRDPRILDIVGITMSDPMAWERCVKLCDRHSLNVKRIPQPEPNGYDLDKRYRGFDDWKRVHHIVGELRSDHPNSTRMDKSAA